MTEVTPDIQRWGDRWARSRTRVNRTGRSLIRPARQATLMARLGGPGPVGRFEQAASTMTLPRQSLHSRRAARARELAEQYPASAEGLRFIAAVVDEQARLDGELVGGSRAKGAGGTAPDDRANLNELARRSRSLVDLVLREGPAPLRDEAEQLSEERCRDALDRFRSPRRDDLAARFLRAGAVASCLGDSASRAGRRRRRFGR